MVKFKNGQIKKKLIFLHKYHNVDDQKYLNLLSNLKKIIKKIIIKINTLYDQ
jgi:uncharacterized protein YutE (UPF0331/DUF86 family)